MTPETQCPRTDAVLSHFLDGDASARSAEALSDHLSDCDPCRDTLRAGRRLDALLAAQAGQLMDRDRADAVLERVISQLQPPTAAPTRGLAPRVLIGTGLLAAGFAAAWFFLPREVVERVEVVEITVPDPTRSELDGAIRLPIPSGPRPAPEDETPPPPPSAEELRLQEARTLLRSGSAGSLDAWVELVAAQDEGPMLDELVAEGRGLRSLRRHLGRELGEPVVTPASLTVALRLGSPELDDRLVQAARRDPGLAPAIAETLAGIANHPNRTQLLLDLWTDLHARGHLEDDEDAASLFAEQPAGTTTELIAEAETTGNVMRTPRCLLALAVRADPASRPFLLSVVEGSNQPDAVVAAFALSQLPTELLDGLLDTETARRGAPAHAWLLRAAMAGARCAAVIDWLTDFELTNEERQFLATGSFSHAQFPIAASLFRERGISIH